MDEHLQRCSENLLIQLDVYLPSQRLAFEYQGEQHYYDIYALGNRMIHSDKSNAKREACEMNKISRIEVPYWWQGDRIKLMATIQQHRPDLIPWVDVSPISLQKLS